MPYRDTTFWFHSVEALDRDKDQRDDFEDDLSSCHISAVSASSAGDTKLTDLPAGEIKAPCS